MEILRLLSTYVLEYSNNRVYAVDIAVIRQVISIARQSAYKQNSTQRVHLERA